MIEPSKDIRIVSSPDTQPPWPVPPEYEPVWDWQRIDRELYKCFTGIDLSWNKVQALCEQIAADYDKVYSLALFQLWQCEGMKDAPPDAAD